MILKVAQHQKRERIDVYLANQLPQITRSKVKEAIETGLITVNGKPIKASFKISPGEEIAIQIQSRPELSYEPEDLPLDIVYEDSNLLVINKSAGMVTHPAHGHYSGTLMNALLGHNRKLSELGEDFRAGIVHRLDMDTTGLLVVAKDEFTHAELSKQFSARTIERKYLALVWWRLKDEVGTIEGNIGRHLKDRKLYTVTSYGRPALTRYRVITRYELFTLLELTLGTGRTHQIRVHLSHFGHPVFGDPTYGGRNARFGSLTPSQRLFCAELLTIMKRQALHAKTLGFLHPVKNEFLRFDSELPEDFRELLSKLR
jgi:23S rRNA pseudouridine1911/1915/1917 synthase